MFKKAFNLFIYFIIDLFTNKVFYSSKYVKNEIVIIKLDAIGDYLLFRNFLKYLSQSSKFINYKFTLVGNIIWKDLYEELDSNFIPNAIWLDSHKFLHDYSYRYKFLQSIKSKGYKIVVNAEFSRSFWISDWIVRSFISKNKIAHRGDFSNSKKWQKVISSFIYNDFYTGNREVTFEFDRNKAFIEYLISSEINIEYPVIKKSLSDLSNNHFQIGSISNYVVLFLGSSKQRSKWDASNYAKLAKHIKEVYNYEIVVCGGSNDLNDSIKFSLSYDYFYTDLIGKTSLKDLISIISNSKLLISNETSAPHMAVSLGVNTIVLYCGNHFGRFIPYPYNFKDFKYKAICHPLISGDVLEYKTISNSYGYVSNLNINDISLEHVIFETDSILSNL